jgi:Tfp pilus assembly protein FimT
MDIMARSNALDRSCKAVRVLGSNDGNTWFFIANLTYTTFTNNVWQNKASTASDKYFYIRVVVMTTISNANLNIGGCRIIYDACS